MRYMILMLVAVISLNAIEVKKIEQVQQNTPKDFTYVNTGISSLLPAYSVTKDITWVLIPGVSFGHRHFITQKNAIDYSASIFMNFNIQLADLTADYLFYPMPKYGFFAGAGVSMNECCYFCFQSNKFHYWSSYHALLGIDFSLDDKSRAFIKCTYSVDKMLSFFYGISY